jgi:hypothetical protein
LISAFDEEALRRFAAVVAAVVLPSSAPGERAKMRRRLNRLAPAAFRNLGADEKERLLLLAEKFEREDKFRPPPSSRALLLLIFGRFAVERWVQRKRRREEASRLRALAQEWLKFASGKDRLPLFIAALRVALAKAGPDDRQLLEVSFQEFERTKERQMPNFVFDTRGLPARFTNTTADPTTGKIGDQVKADYLQKVKDILENTYGLDLTTTDPTTKGLVNQPTLSYVVGSLLQAENFDEGSYAFAGAVGTAWTKSLAKVETLGKKAEDGTPLRLVLADILKVLEPVPATPAASAAVTPAGAAATPAATAVTVFYQELAAIADYVKDNARSVPYGHPSFARQVLIGRDRYVAGPPPADSLDLPPLTGPGATDVEIEPENVKAVGTVYLALQMERMRLFHVVDRITYYFMQGLVALPYDAASRALDDYYWTSEDRLNEAARNSIYGRVLGAPGSDVSKDVQPNRDFDGLLSRFIASVAEFDRERRVADLFVGLRGATPSSASQEQIRKAGRDVLSNASLYGWGGTQPSARRLKQHVLQALDILRMPQLQKVYGVTSPYQIIERVTMSEFGQAPNIVKCRTMAESGKKILDALARNVPAFATTSQKPLFTTDSVIGDILKDDTQILINESNSWLAVNAIAADEAEKLSKPVETRYAPSMPVNGAGHNGASPDLVDKLQQMVKSGSAPSLDQLQQLLPAFK